MENVDLNKKPSILAPLLLSSLPPVKLTIKYIEVL